MVSKEPDRRRSRIASAVSRAAADRYGKRGDAVDKRFTRLKTGLGHGATKTFHGIRHSECRATRTTLVPTTRTAAKANSVPDL